MADQTDGQETKCNDCTLLKTQVESLKADLSTMNQKLDDLIDMNKQVTSVGEQMAEVKSFLVSIDKQVKQDEVKNLMIEIQKRLEGVASTEKCFNNNMPRISNPVVEETAAEETEARIIICGGASESDTCEMLIWSTKTWVPLQVMRCYRNSSSAFLYKDQVFLTGGSSGAKGIETLKIDTSDITTEEWCSFKGSLPRGTALHTAEVYNNTLFVIGGCSTRNEGDVFDDIIYIDLEFPYIGRRATSMPHPKFGHCSHLISDKIFICGGSSGECTHASGAMLMYDINKNNCSQVALMPYAAIGMAMVYYDSKLIMIGGLNPSRNALDTSFTYDISSGKVEMLPPMKCQRYYPSAVVVGNNIVVMGGNDDNGDALNTVEIFNFESHSWQDFPSMTKPRSGSTALKI